MAAWADYVPTVTKHKDLWTGCWTYGDWLTLDHPEGYVAPRLELSKRGYSDDGLVCSAFYANSLNLVIQAGRILGRDLIGTVTALLHDDGVHSNGAIHVVSIRMNVIKVLDKDLGI
jgi:hypothetical protein